MNCSNPSDDFQLVSSKRELIQTEEKFGESRTTFSNHQSISVIPQVFPLDGAFRFIKLGKKTYGFANCSKLNSLNNGYSPHSPGSTSQTRPVRLEFLSKTAKIDRK